MPTVDFHSYLMQLLGYYSLVFVTLFMRLEFEIERDKKIVHTQKRIPIENSNKIAT